LSYRKRRKKRKREQVLKEKMDKSLKGASMPIYQKRRKEVIFLAAMLSLLRTKKKS